MDSERLYIRPTMKTKMQGQLFLFNHIMDEHVVDKETGVVCEMYKSKIFVMVPCMSPRTGRGLLRYIQSLHQHQQNQELKSGPRETYREHMRSQQQWLLR
jgi:hypothetical protein